jgi:pyrimidine deaminase RibD-like protein
MNGQAARFVTLGGECFEAETRSVNAYQGRDGVAHTFYLTDLVRNRGKHLVSVFISGTLAATCANYESRAEIMRFNAIRRAFDQGVLDFDTFGEGQNAELFLSSRDVQPQLPRRDGEIREYIVNKAYWLAHRFPTHSHSDGVLYPIPFDEPADLEYMGISAHDVWTRVRRLGNEGLLEKILEGHGRPTEFLLSRYESGDRVALGLTPTISADLPTFSKLSDRRFSRLAIDEARKSSPEDKRIHPRVGVVIVRDDRVLASAHRGEIVECHAEYIALEKKLADIPLSGATVYTTLEPCTARNHPKVPCAVRLAERKVARVLIGMLDPDDRISGRGQRTLRRAGIATELFAHDLMAEIEELNRDFIRDRESQASLSIAASVFPTSAMWIAPPRVRIALKRGHVSNFLVEYANDEDEPVSICETRLFGGKNGHIELTEPLLPDDPSTWRVGAHCSATFGKSIVSGTDPAASLIKMNSNKGIFFETEIVLVATCEIRGQRAEVRQTLYVKVNATRPEIIPLV